jgi:hypothetical protein
VSGGPIQQHRDTWKPLRVSTVDGKRVCFDVKGHGYCGRTSAKERTSDWKKVVCWDCVAAALADAVRLPAGVTA